MRIKEENNLAVNLRQVVQRPRERVESSALVVMSLAISKNIALIERKMMRMTMIMLLDMHRVEIFSQSPKVIILLLVMVGF